MQITGRSSGVIHFLASGKEPMCLYGYPDGSWELTLPEEMVPPGLPVPTRGINRRRDYVNRSDYLTLVAHHSDSWLMGVTFFLSTHLDANCCCCSYHHHHHHYYYNFVSQTVFFVHLTFRTFICAI